MADGWEPPRTRCEVSLIVPTFFSLLPFDRMLYAKDGSFLLDAEARSRPDLFAAGPILVQAFLQYLCQGAFCVCYR